MMPARARPHSDTVDFQTPPFQDGFETLRGMASDKDGAFQMTAWLPRLAQAIYAGSLVVMAAINLNAAPLIATDKVPMQWGLDGAPTWYASKPVGLWFPVALAVVIGAAVFQRARYEAAAGDARGWFWLGGTGCLMAAVQAWHVSAIVASAGKQA